MKAAYQVIIEFYNRENDLPKMESCFILLIVLLFLSCLISGLKFEFRLPDFHLHGFLTFPCTRHVKYVADQNHIIFLKESSKQFKNS